MVRMYDTENDSIKNAFLDRVSSGSLDSVRDMMKKFKGKFSVNCTNPSGETPLIIAARRNDLPMVSYLLDECHADPNAKEPVFKRTAEFYAIKHGNQDMLALIRHVCDNTASITKSESSLSSQGLPPRRHS